MAGPEARAGFMAAPVSGPMANMSAVTVRPMPKPPIFGARGSTAVPRTAVIRKKVAMNSARNAPPRVTTGATIAGIAGRAVGDHAHAVGLDDGDHGEGSEDAAGDLGEDVQDGGCRFDLAQHEQSDGDCGVDVPAGNRRECGDDDGQDQSMGQRNAHERGVGVGAIELVDGHDAYESEGEYANRLGKQRGKQFWHICFLSWR